MKKILILLLILLSLSGCSNTDNKANESVSNNSQEVTESKESSEDYMVFQKESDHFKFYSFNKDNQVIDDLTKELEGNYERITDTYKTYPEEKFDVYIYSDVESFHESLDLTNAPGWVVSSFMNYKEIHIVSPSNPGEHHDYDSILKAAFNSFTRAIIKRINSNLPKWLSLGIPQYERQIKIKFPEGFKEDNIPELTELESPSSIEISTFYISYTVVEFIVDKYGYDTLIELIKKPDNYEEIFGFNKVEFEKKWRDYIIDKYLK
ncbi:lipoprotein [Oceanirhabdus sp. W0125-5]|uniref:lipoprotein n=1 Tax=Oceanirhabdus sp. W0125-5 TaxID=2999116 RepID=UPI0022F300E5|nr:lipoprotein [Oceanirhabdus sp. W0125-5]WBW96190.1 hypothetical protein OW730_21225 [Oceanirhabdus sp. W0125-5]